MKRLSNLFNSNSGIDMLGGESIGDDTKYSLDLECSTYVDSAIAA